MHTASVVGHGECRVQASHVYGLRNERHCPVGSAPPCAWAGVFSGCACAGSASGSRRGVPVQCERGNLSLRERSVLSKIIMSYPGFTS